MQFKECPYAERGYRAHIRDMLNDFEQKYHGTKQGVIQSFLALLPTLKKKELEETVFKNKSILLCQKCSEPANQNICQACKIKKELEHKDN